MPLNPTPALMGARMIENETAGPVPVGTQK